MAARVARLTAPEYSFNFNYGPSNYSLTGELTTTYDEIRYGTSLCDVVVIPEARTGLLVLVGLVFLSVTPQKIGLNHDE